jgi:hypothetical protein
MTTNTNVTPFAKLVGEFLSNVNSGQGISARLVVAMANMETMFTADWLKRFHALEGKDKTAMLHAGLTDLYDGFVDLVETAKLKSADLSPRMLDKKADAQKQLKSLENIMREAFFGVSYLRLKECSKYEIKNARRIRYVIAGAWNNDIGDTFDGIVSKGRKACIEAKWINAPVNSNTATTGAANNGTSIANLAKQMENAGTSLPSVSVQLFKSVATLLASMPIDNMPKDVADAYVEAEAAFIRKSYGKEDGSVDLKAIGELYNPKAAPQTAKPTTKKGKGGVTLSANASDNAQKVA